MLFTVSFIVCDATKIPPENARFRQGANKLTQNNIHMKESVNQPMNFQSSEELTRRILHDSVGELPADLNLIGTLEGLPIESTDGPALHRPQETRGSLMNGFSINMPSYGLMSIVAIDPSMQVYDNDFYVALQPRNAAPAEVVVWYNQQIQNSSLWIWDWGVGKPVFGLPLFGPNENAIMKRWGRPYKLLDGRTVPSFAVFTYFNPNPQINRNVVCLLNAQNKWDLVWASNVVGKPAPATASSGWAACEWTRGAATAHWPIIPNGTGCCEPFVLDTNFRLVQPNQSQIGFMNNLTNYRITNYSQGHSFLCQGPK